MRKDPTSTGGVGASSPSEQARLDEAMRCADDLLLDSLRKDERRRRNRLFIFFSSIGGLAMLAIVTYLVFGLGVGGSVAANGSAQQLVAEGWKLWQGGAPDKAVEKFEAAVKLDPKNESALNGLGWSQFSAGHAEEAEKAFKRLIALVPKHPAALNGLGQAALSQRNYKDAEKYLLQAAPKAPAAWYGLARLYLLEGKFDQAKKWAGKLVDSGEADETVQAMLKAAEAKKLGDELRAEIEPQAPKPAGQRTSAGEVARGWRLINQGNHDEAQKMFKQALANDEKDAAAINGLGWRYCWQARLPRPRPSSRRQSRSTRTPPAR